MAPKKTKICGTSAPAKICPQWGLNQVPFTSSALFYHSPMTQICQIYATQGSYLDMLSKKKFPEVLYRLFDHCVCRRVCSREGL